MTIKLIIIIILGFYNCISMPATSDLENPITQMTLKETVVVNKVKVEIDDSYKKAVQDNLTMNLKEFLDKGNYFERTILFTEKDSNLKNFRSLEFEFDKYEHVRRPYGWYFPLAFITLTFYIWFGGTITIDDLNYSAKLSVRDEKEKIVFEVKKEVFEEREINFYSNEKYFPKGSSARTKLVKDILAEYQKQRKEKP